MRYEGFGCFRLKTKEITRTVLALFTADITLHFKIALQTRKVRELVRLSQKNRMANMLKLIFANHDPEIVRFHGVPLARHLGSFSCWQDVSCLPVDVEKLAKHVTLVHCPFEVKFASWSSIPHVSDTT